MSNDRNRSRNLEIIYCSQLKTQIHPLTFNHLDLGSQYLEVPEEFNNNDAFPHLNISFSTVEPFSRHTPDLIVPIFTIFEFIGYLGWIKVRGRN